MDIILGFILVEAQVQKDRCYLARELMEFVSGANFRTVMTIECVYDCRQMELVSSEKRARLPRCRLLFHHKSHETLIEVLKRLLSTIECHVTWGDRNRLHLYG